MSAAYSQAIREAAPQATIVYDRFHVARLSNFALDEVRADQMKKVHPFDRPTVNGCRRSLFNLDPLESRKLASITRTNQPLYRGHLLKESFLEIFASESAAEARIRMLEWIEWAQRSKLDSFVRLARTVRRHLEGILEFIASRLTNARLEGMNNKIRLLSHRAFGFHSAEPLIAMIYLCCGGIILPKPQLI